MASVDVHMVDMDIPNQMGALKVDSTSGEEMNDYESTDESSVDESSFQPRGLTTRDLPTGLCYDERMRYHAEVSALSAEAVHPEDPRRIYYIYKELCEAGLVVAKGFDVMVEQPLLRIDAREATEDEIRLVHTDEQYRFVQHTSRMTNEELIDLAEHGDSIYFNKLSYFSGLLSAGGAIETCKAVMEGRVKNAIAVIRPPGHHAEAEQPMGFCLFNNTCIASKVCQKLYDVKCRKVLILDWDVHHGNGCQKSFYNDPNILYISLHVHMGGKFYPSGPEGGMDRCGVGAGEGYNVNIPWETKGMGDGDYMYAFQHVVMPIATSFDPDLVIVSAGFDAAAGDELGGCNVTPACYAHMTHMLMSLAQGRVAVCLEGGYNFRAISRSALAVTRTLMGEPPDRLEATSATDSAVRVIEDVKKTQSRYWRCMYPRAPTSGIYGGERLHDIIRAYQAQNLFNKYKLTELLILRDKISKSFDKQVLGSISYERRKHLIVFFHDPPDLLTGNNPLAAQQKPHDTWMLDGSQAYIQSAVKHGIGVIDVNIPEFITITADPSVDDKKHAHQEIAYNSHYTDAARTEGEKLASYIWENYIEPYDFEGGIWLIGAGSAFHAVWKLVTEKENIHTRLNGVIGFNCDHPARQINPNSNNAYASSWFREHSRIYVAKNHEIWRRAEQLGKTPSKRYGKLFKSPETMLNSMMQKHLPEVFDFIRETANLQADSDSDADLPVPMPEDEGNSPLRGSAFSSPPQNRPLTASATAQSSAALRGALSPPATSSAAQRLSQGSNTHTQKGTTPLGGRSPLPPSAQRVLGTIPQSQSPTSPPAYLTRPEQQQHDTGS
ncbi:Histone deacetylase hda1 [Lithohypha guttulata]|nr:Histone deacetylase hda1 [Lithohypha guttulata]